MAKLSKEILEFQIIVNGNEAQQQINKINERNKELSRSLDDERDKLKKLKYNKTQNREEIIKTEASIKKLTLAYEENLKEIDEICRGMKIEDLTMQQLKRRIDELAFAKRHMAQSDPNYDVVAGKLDQLNSRYRQLQSGMGSAAFTMKELSDKINQYSALITMTVIAVTSMVIAINKAIDINNKLADAQSAVSKTTGLNIEQVRELTEAFKEFDTRTSQLDLLKIAEIGGRLGVAQNEIKDFTKEVDKIYVALGDGFTGGVEQVANSLGKLKGLYKETKDIPIAEAMNRVGSAINELGAAGAASEENITEFAKRIGSLPDSMRPAIADALALGASFEEFGVDAERSGTAYSTFVKIAARSTDKFAEVMKMTKKEVDALINTNPMEFFLKFAEMAKGMDATELAKVLDYLKLNDQYVSSIVSAASDNMGRFRENLALSNEEYKKAISLQKEFDKVNNNAAAIYDKIKKKFEQMYTSETVANTLSWLVEKFGQLIGAIKDTDGTMTKIRETIIFLTKLFLIGATAVVSYNTAVILSTNVLTTAQGRLIGLAIAQKAYNVITTVSTFLSNLYTASVARMQLAYAGLTGNTVLQTAAQAKLNAVTMANPFGALIAVVLAAAAAVYLFSEKTDEAVEKQKELNKIHQEANKAIISQKNELQSLLQVARDETASKEARLAAIKKLNEISPEYLGNLTLENINTQKATDAVNKYTEALYRASRARVLQKKMDEKVEEYEDLKNKPVAEAGGKDWLWKLTGGKLKLTGSEAQNLDTNMFKQMKIWEEKGGKNYAREMMKVYGEYYEKRNQSLRATGETINSLQKEIVDMMKKDLSVIDPDKNKQLSAPTAEGGGKKTKTKGKGTSTPQKSQYEKDLEEIFKLSEKYAEKDADFQAEMQKRKIEIMEDGFEKEKLLLELESQEKIRNYENQKISAEEMAKLDDMIAKTKDGKVKTRLEEERKIWERHNKNLTDLQKQEMQISETKTNTLREKYRIEDIKKQDESVKRKLENLKRWQNEDWASYKTLEDLKADLKGKISDEELAQIKTWEDGKKALQKRYQIMELDVLTEHLEEMKKVYEDMGLSILSEDQKNDIIKRLDEVNDTLAETAAKKKDIANGEGGNGEKLGGRLSGIGGGNTDILGLIPDQWEAMFTNTNNLTENIQKVTAAIVVLQNAFGAYAQYAKANEDALLQKMESASQRKQIALKKQLLEGYINQETYKKLTIKNEQDLEKKKAELALKAAKREKAMAIAQTVTNTAQAIMQIWAQSSPFVAPFLTAMVGVLGAVQLATIMSQPLPEVTGAEEGLYPVIREQDGKLFSARKRRSRSGVYSEPTLLVGEAGASMPELVVSGRDLKRIDPEITKMFMRDIDRVRGYEKGMYPSAPTPVSSNNDEVLIAAMAIIKKNSEILERIEQNGITAIISKNARNGKEIDEMRQEYLDLKNKNKH